LDVTGATEFALWIETALILLGVAAWWLSRAKNVR
jgi:hypothetical protein